MLLPKCIHSFYRKYVQLPIEATYINPKHRYALDELMAALKAIYCNREYNAAIFSILEKRINSGKKNTGRPGMDLWCIFVLAQVRLCLDMSYEGLHHNANNNHVMRRLMGVERDFGYERIEFEYQQIYDNVSQLGDDLISELSRVIPEFGYGHVFKKNAGLTPNFNQLMNLNSMVTKNTSSRGVR